MKHGIYYVVIAIPIVISGILLYDHTQSIQFMQSTVPDNQITPYGCGHDLFGNFFYHYYGACSGGTPTIPSQVKGIPQDTIRELVDYDKKIYIEMIHGGHCPQGSCGYSIAGLCQYDSNGEFIPHLSEDQKKVLLDLTYTYGFDICPFTGKPNVFSSNTAPAGIRIVNETIIGPSGSVNVTELGINKSQTSK